MHGLLRVRGFTQDDAHIFCTPRADRRRDRSLPRLRRSRVQDLRLQRVSSRALDCATRTRPASSSAMPPIGRTPSRSLTDVLERSAVVSFKTIPGEAAFYGPKIDIKLVDVLGRLWQLSTVQFDFNLPDALRARVRRRRWRAPSARHGAPRALRLGRALLRRAHRALRRRLSASGSRRCRSASCPSARSTRLRREREAAPRSRRSPRRARRLATRR